MTLQQFVSELPSEDLRIKFTQLEQLLNAGKAKEKCQEIIGECSLHIDWDTIGKFLAVNHVKRWTYYRIMERNNGKPRQVEWIGSTANEVCQKVAREWQERKDESMRWYRPLKKAEAVQRLLERIIRYIEIPQVTKSEKEFCSFKGVYCTWCRGGKCIIQNDKPINQVEECFL